MPPSGKWPEVRLATLDYLFAASGTATTLVGLIVLNPGSLQPWQRWSIVVGCTLLDSMVVPRAQATYQRIRWYGRLHSYAEQAASRLLQENARIEVVGGLLSMLFKASVVIPISGVAILNGNPHLVLRNLHEE